MVILLTASNHHHLFFTDVTTAGEHVYRIRAHREIINAVDRSLAAGRGMGTQLVATASDDKTVKVCNPGEDGGRVPLLRLTAVCWSADRTSLYVGGLDNGIHDSLNDTPTSLALSPSFSSQTIIHDVRPFLPSPTRIHRVLQSVPAGFEHTLLRGVWSKDDGGQRVVVGGADRMVCIWEVVTGKILCKLPGHKGTITSIDFHPKEPIILTASKDGTMLLGEIDSSISI